MKKIGERCDVITDKCYDGTCLGVCECLRGERASADKMQCVGNLYGEKCKSKEYNIYDWSSFKCETSKCQVVNVTGEQPIDTELNHTVSLVD